MIKKSIVSLCLLFSLATWAQEGTASPYSFFGIGDIRYKGTTEIRSMGGVGIEQDSIHINLDNPASYASLKLTTFTVGGSYNTSTQKTTAESAKTTRSTLDYLAVGLPLGKFGVGFGMIPYSSVGYRIVDDGTNGSAKYDGKGGLNKVFVGAGYKFNPKWSFGAEVHYNFGKIETNTLETVSGIPVGTTENNIQDLSGANFNVGLLFQTKLTSKLNFHSSLNYVIESKLKSKSTRTISTVRYDSNFNITEVDSEEAIVPDVNLQFPSKIAIGAGIGESRKWLIGTQLSLSSAANLNNNYNALSNVSYEGAQKMSLGGYYIPNYNSFTSYFKRMIYRGGFRFEKTGLIVNNQSIKDMALTLGIGFPVSGQFSNLNLGLELGRKGTTSSNLVQENYASFNLSFSLNDRWFEKRKYN